MKILILTGKFGMGHIKCAQAINEKIAYNYPDAEVKVIDFMDYCFESLSNVIYKTFEFCAFKMTGTYNYIAKVSDKNDRILFKQIFTKKIEELVAKEQPNLVIACLPLCVQYFSVYKRKNHSDIPLFVYITDICVHKEWISKEVNEYFVGDEETAEALSFAGVSRNIIHTTGIPVSDSFYKICPSKDANKSSVLIMGGGLGMIPGGLKTLKTLNDSHNIEVTLVCGKNKKLLKQVKKLYPNINAKGYCNDVASLMSESDAIITKPGGITTFEAIRSETPLYIIEPTLAQEIENAKYIEKNNLGHIVYDSDSFNEDDLVSFIKDKARINRIRTNMRRVSSFFEDSDPLNYLVEVA